MLALVPVVPSVWIYRTLLHLLRLVPHLANTHSKKLSFVNKEVKLDIFNFAMEKVHSKIYNLNSYYGALKWDGRDLSGNHVANGVYFIRLNFSSSRNQSPGDNWTKLIVVK